jgi:hypothetical protein
MDIVLIVVAHIAVAALLLVVLTSLTAYIRTDDIPGGRSSGSWNTDTV